jgi:peptide/nickel transport system substrate-binding protein
MRRSSLIASGVASTVALGAGVAGIATGATVRADARSSAATSGQLVIDTVFDQTTADPGHVFDSTGQIIDHAVYSTLLTYTNNNDVKLRPQLATHYTVSDHGARYTFDLNSKATFADGSSVTSADVLFSFKRLQNLKGKPSSLLSGISVSAPTPSKVVLSTKTPDAEIPEIVTNPSLGVLESSLVQSYGGTDAPNAAKTDTAETWLNGSSAGSGPYEISSWKANGPVELVANQNYWGPTPKYQTVIIQNVRPEQQRRDVERGAAQVALDLSPGQAKSITNARVTYETSTFAVVTSKSITDADSNPAWRIDIASVR